MINYIKKISHKTFLLAGISLSLISVPAIAIEEYNIPIPSEEKTEAPLPQFGTESEIEAPVPSTREIMEDYGFFKKRPAAKTQKSAAQVVNQQEIVGIEVEGNQIIKDSDIVRELNMSIGDTYDIIKVQQGLTRLYNMGWFTDKMRAVPISDERDKSKVVLKIYLEENKPITDFTITENTVVSDGEIYELLAPLESKPQNIVNLNDAVSRIEQLYASKGYILARVSDVKDDPDGCVNIKISEGYINTISFEGNEKTKDFVVDRNILSTPGAVYNENQIKEDLIRLYGTQAFKDVNRTIEASENADYYDITIELEEQRTATISLGAGLDTATGFFGQLGFVENNFLGRGQRVSLNFLAGTGVLLSDSSTLDRANLQGEISFYEPRFLGTDVGMMYKAYWRDFASYQVPLSVERRLGVEAVATKEFKKFRNLSGSFKVGIENVHMEEGDLFKIAGLYAAHGIPFTERAKQLQGGTFLALSPSLVYDSRDKIINPRSGVIANLRYTENIGLNDLSLTHGTLTGGAKKYFPVMSKSAISVSARAGGAIHGDVPEAMAFRMGGPYSVRGYKMSSIGTGDSYVMGSVELTTPFFFLDRIKQVKFLDNIKFALFVDAGKMFNETISDKIYNRPGYGVAAGAGIKVYIPGVGPLSIDYGYPLVDVGKGNSKGAFTFGIGDLF